MALNVSASWRWFQITVCVCDCQRQPTLHFDVTLKILHRRTTCILQAQLLNLVLTVNVISQTFLFLIGFLNRAPFSSLWSIIWTFKVSRGGTSLNFFRTSPAQSLKRKNYKSSALQMDRYWLSYVEFFKNHQKFLNGATILAWNYGWNLIWSN